MHIPSLAKIMTIEIIQKRYRTEFISMHADLACLFTQFLCLYFDLTQFGLIGFIPLVVFEISPPSKHERRAIKTLNRFLLLFIAIIAITSLLIVLSSSNEEPSPPPNTLVFLPRHPPPPPLQPPPPNPPNHFPHRSPPPLFPHFWA